MANRDTAVFYWESDDFDVSDFTLAPALEDLVLAVEMVVVLFIAVPAHFVFFQDPDHKLFAAFFPAFFFKEPDHLGTDALSYIGGIDINEMEFKGAFLILILIHADAHHGLDDPGVGIFIHVHIKPLFRDPAGVDRDAVLHGQVF